MAHDKETLTTKLTHKGNKKILSADEVRREFAKLRTLKLDGRAPYTRISESTMECHRLRRMAKEGDVMAARERLHLKAYDNKMVDHRGAEWLHIDSLPVVIEAAFYKMESADRAKWLYEEYLTTVERLIDWASEHEVSTTSDISEGGGTHRYYIDELGFIVYSMMHGGSAVDKAMRCGFRLF